jgi:hypothetical protein
MDRYIISSESEANDLIPICMAIHELVGKLPVTARSKKCGGIRIENGVILNRDYSGPVLEEVLDSGSIKKTTPQTGQYKGIPVIVSPVHNDLGETIAAIGLVDITGVFDLATLMEHQSMIIKQVCGTDPCPLPGERTGSKR